MPASSLSSIMNWGVYLAATLALASFLAPAALGVLGEARENAAASTVSGIRALIDALRPGDSVDLTFASSGTAFLVLTRGNLVGYRLGSSSSFLPCEWTLETATLYASREYLLTLANGTVEVSEVGRG